LQRSSV
jgi:hypothetical protein